jgi:hypothetical protein
MALGPKLSFIKAGDVLVADTVMQNFQAIVDFLRAIPSTNLLQYKYTWNTQVDFDAIAILQTVYSGYAKVNAGGTPFALEMTASIDSAIAGVFAAGTSVTVTWQKCTPSASSGPVAIDVWSDLSPSITFNSTTTAPAYLVPDALASARYCQTQVVNNNVVSLSDGDWVRAKIVTAGLAAVRTATVQLIVKNPLRS